MYYIKKYADCWAVQDAITGGSRKLSTEEVERIKNEFSAIKDEKVIVISSDSIRSLITTREYYQQTATSL